uniref:Uncharacterized protein n=1 Tax=Plectus sambesii TaxID=2011161 RepID=A0A914WBK0_9BILA
MRVVLLQLVLGVTAVAQAQQLYRSQPAKGSDDDKRNFDRDFLHFGKRDDVDFGREFMPFGKRDEFDREFLHFGKKSDFDREFMPFGKKSEAFDREFMPFGKRQEEGEKRARRNEENLWGLIETGPGTASELNIVMPIALWKAAYLTLSFSLPLSLSFSLIPPFPVCSSFRHPTTPLLPFLTDVERRLVSLYNSEPELCRCPELAQHSVMAGIIVASFRWIFLMFICALLTIPSEALPITDMQDNTGLIALVDKQMSFYQSAQDELLARMAELQRKRAENPWERLGPIWG